MNFYDCAILLVKIVIFDPSNYPYRYGRMHKSGGSRGGPSAQVEVISPSMSVGEGELTFKMGIRGGGMATEVRKV